jgi:serine protease Do
MCPQWQGSGFILSPHIIGTARHVVEGIESFEITLDDGTVVHATRAISSKDHDIAFIWVEEELPNPVELGDIEDCELGQELFAIGSGYGKVNFNSVTKGIVSAW